MWYTTTLIAIILVWLSTLEWRMRTMPVTQADIDAIKDELVADEQKLADFITAVGTHEAALQAQIDALQAANPNLDLSGVKTAADAIGSALDAAKP